jgi:hypothetical protein
VSGRRQFSDVGVDPGALRSARSAKALERRHKAAGLALEHAKAALAELGRGVHVFGLTKGQFSMIDLAAAVLDLTGPADVSLWTWCIAEYEVQAVSAFLNEGRIRSFRMVMDWAGAKRDMPLVADLQGRYGNDCIRVTKTHAKVVTVANEAGWRVVIRGSMNLNNNPRFEQFDVSDDPAVFGVVAGLEAELWQRGKALAVAELAHRDATDLLGVAEAKTHGAPPAWAASLKAWG